MSDPTAQCLHTVTEGNAEATQFCHRDDVLPSLKSLTENTDSSSQAMLFQAALMGREASVSVCTLTTTCMHMLTHTYSHMHACIHRHACMHTCTCMYAYIYAWTCTNKVYTHARAHTHTHTLKATHTHSEPHTNVCSTTHIHHTHSN